MKRKSTKQKKRGGFTLVEMLVVILIIGVLVGLVSAAAVQALKRAKVAKIVMEITQLSLALNNYKTTFGEYPPDFFGVDNTDTAIRDAAREKVLRHLARAFPRYPVPSWDVLRDTIYNNSLYTIKGIDYHVDLNKMGPHGVLVFWLGGMPDANGRPSGFSKNPENPFEKPSNQPSRIGPFYDFDLNRLNREDNDPDNLGKYYPPGVPEGIGQPYIYFRAETGQGHPREYYLMIPNTPPTPPTYTFKTFTTSSGNIVRPYWDERTKCWVNDTSYQILCCGVDGAFGLENVYPSGQKDDPDDFPTVIPPELTNLKTTDVQGLNDFFSSDPNYYNYLDDQTNFTSGTIGNDMP